MSRDAINGHSYDEDTQAYLGHTTNQAKGEPKQVPDDRNQREAGPERSPKQIDDQKRRTNEKPNRDNRK